MKLVSSSVTNTKSVVTTVEHPDYGTLTLVETFLNDTPIDSRLINSEGADCSEFSDDFTNLYDEVANFVASIDAELVVDLGAEL